MVHAIAVQLNLNFVKNQNGWQAQGVLPVVVTALFGRTDRPGM
ncbi:hypothetical protein [Pseudovibrio sp. Ad37]|nr:hypothetical protein [Pseudovibrio sp. Ad37]KZL24806.1 hypothetical protein PsAD37_02465 [Pseudovibrio sp. Ad37]